MKKSFLRFGIVLLFISTTTALSSFSGERSKEKHALRFPYKQAGLSEREAAAHLLSRFSFGATPGQVDEVVKMGLEKWFAAQLTAKVPDDSLDARLSQYPLMSMSTEEIIRISPDATRVLKMAIEDGVIKNDSIGKNLLQQDKSVKKQYREQIETYMAQKGIIPRKELFRQVICQKIERALYSNNQLQELLTDFWFNHFNVSITKNECSRFIPSYERDVIRPNVLGKFETLLLATAKSPAMLAYLDNAKSSVSKQNSTANQQKQQQRAMQALEQAEMMDSSAQKAALLEKLKKAKKEQGLNENYAREIMELHTMGVDGGYTQSDVTQAARVLTGWTIYPMDGYGAKAAQTLVERIGPEKFEKQGFVHDGAFLFNANKHDKGEKTVLGTFFPSQGGYEEGLKLIDILANHPKTAQFICKKLAVRFVTDDPPSTLVDKMAKTFAATGGDIKQVLIAMATAPEFWSRAAVREKTKSPFELAISALRGLDADVKLPYQVYSWIAKMGENIYYYQAPTGFPDKGQYWINTGSLLYRMNFGLALATHRIPGVSFNLAALNNNKEPESAEAALQTYGKLLMPGRDMTETIKRLTPLLNEPELAKKVNEALGKTTTSAIETPMEPAMQADESMMMDDYPKEKPLKESPGKKRPMKNDTNINQLMVKSGDNSVLAQVVGILIGSPEYQRK